MRVLIFCWQIVHLQCKVIHGYREILVQVWEPILLSIQKYDEYDVDDKDEHVKSDNDVCGIILVYVECGVGLITPA